MDAKEDANDSLTDGFLLRFPPELLAEIASHLPNSDIKSLRQTCSQVCSVVELRLGRVFLSPSPLNVKVFYAIASHDRFRMAVREIIYDDARFRTDWVIPTEADTTAAARPAPVRPENADNVGQEEQGPLPLLTEEQEIRTRRRERGAMHMSRARCQQNMEELIRRRGRDSELLPQHARRRAMAEAAAATRDLRGGSWWRTCTSLARQQAGVIDAGADAIALRRVLGRRRFPNLARVTITPAAHGFLYTPLYQTPMIRALPYGFNYPLPRGWPHARLASIADGSDSDPWLLEAADPDQDQDTAQQRVWHGKQRWRGLLVVLETLAGALRKQQQQRKKRMDGDGYHVAAPLSVKELVLDVHGLDSGLSPRMLGQQSVEYTHMTTILDQPGFRRLDLPLLLGGMAKEGWEPLTNGFFCALLSRAVDLEHFRLVSDTLSDDDEAPPTYLQQQQQQQREVLESVRHCPLDKMLPLFSGGWRRLRHLGLSGVPVRVDDVVAVLAAAPPSLRSVELSFLRFVDRDGCYEKLVRAVKTSLVPVWRDRCRDEEGHLRRRQQQHSGGPSLLPRITIGLVPPLTTTSRQPGRGIWLTREVAEYLYGEGGNPFLVGEGSMVEYGVGVVRDEFEAEYERPFLGAGEMVGLGIYEEEG